MESKNKILMNKKSAFYKILLKYYLSYIKASNRIKNLKYEKEVILLRNNHNIENRIQEIERKIQSGDTDLTYYIIRRDNPSIGLLTFVSVFMGHIAYAIAKGYVPVIDMKSYKSIYIKEEDVNQINAWELFFEQPMAIRLEEIPSNARIEYSPKYINPSSPFINSLFATDEKLFWKRIANKFIRLNTKTENYILEEYNALLANKKILGLLYRGTDYKSLKPKDHPIQPDVDLFISMIKEKLDEWGNFDGFYLATDEENVVKRLEKEFPGKIIVNRREYYDSFTDISYLAEAKFNRDNDEFIKGLEYLSSIKLLSTSDSIIAGLCAGTYAANFLKKENFRHEYFFNLGVY